MNLRIGKAVPLTGRVTLPGDKSIAHRALILSALAAGPVRGGGKSSKKIVTPVTNASNGAGKSIIRNVPDSDDIRATVQCLCALGVKITSAGPGTFIISGVGLRGLQSPSGPLDARESGTTLRLFTGLLAAQPFSSRITGTTRLRQRPMDRVIIPLRRMGALIHNNHSTLEIKGKQLHGLNYRLPVPSAQVKSALLMAGLFVRGTTIISEPIPSRDHTERILRAMGVKLTVTNKTITLTPPARLSPLNLTLPGDISSAAYFIAAACLIPHSCIEITRVGLNPLRLGFIKALQKMGARITGTIRNHHYNEPVGTVTAFYSSLKAIRIAGPVIPTLIDEIPILAVLATQATGTTVIKGAAELRRKESDRIAALARELKRLQANIKEIPDGLIIKGPTPLTGTTCYSHNDHRIAMSLAVAGLIARGQTTIRRAECIRKSFPGFTGILRKIT